MDRPSPPNSQLLLTSPLTWQSCLGQHSVRDGVLPIYKGKQLRDNLCVITATPPKTPRSLREANTVSHFLPSAAEGAQLAAGGTRGIRNALDRIISVKSLSGCFGVIARPGRPLCWPGGLAPKGGWEGGNLSSRETSISNADKSLITYIHSHLL
jgi:hypothetical protein